MNPLKKQINDLLSRPSRVATETGPNVDPSSSKKVSSKRGSKPDVGINRLASKEHPSNLKIPSSYYAHVHATLGSGSNPSRATARNPLKKGCPGPDYEKQGSKVTRKSKIEAGAPMKTNKSSMELKGSTVYDNFKQLVYEVERKDAKIRRLESEIENAKLAADPKELDQLKKQLNEALRTFRAEEHRHGALAGRNEQTKEETEQLSIEIEKKRPILDKQKNYFKSVGQLQGEFDQSQVQLGGLKGEYGKKVINDKIRIEKEIKAKMESQLLQLTLDVARESNNPEIQKLYSKLRGKNIVLLSED